MREEREGALVLIVEQEMSKVVFVGNIPFEMTEEQIIDIFKEVGPVVSFKYI